MLQPTSSSWLVLLPGAPAPAAAQENAYTFEDATPDGDDSAADGSFSAVGFSYDGGEGVADATEPEGDADGEPYEPGFPVPSHLSPLLRGVTDRSHQVSVTVPTVKCSMFPRGASKRSGPEFQGKNFRRLFDV